MHNGSFWQGIFRNSFVPSFDLLTAHLDKILVPYSAAEVNKVAGGMSDMDEQGTYCLTMIAVEQTLLNMFAMSMYHIFEQQMFRFIREEVYQQKWVHSWYGKEDELGEEKTRELKSVRWYHYSKKRSKGEGKTPFILDLNWLNIESLLKEVIDIDVSTFQSASLLKEHRLLANTIKHAEGGSCQELRDLNPSLFQSRFGSRIEPESPRKKTTTPVYSPLTGEDIYVKVTDIQKYRDNLELFWHELGEAIAEDFD